MRTLSDRERRRRYTALRARKRRADRLNSICYKLILVNALYGIVFPFFSDGSLMSLRFLFLYDVSVTLALAGCRRRSFLLTLLANGVYLAGVFTTNRNGNLFYDVVLLMSLLAGYTESNLRQEAGYPRFDPPAGEIVRESESAHRRRPERENRNPHLRHAERRNGQSD